VVELCCVPCGQAKFVKAVTRLEQAQAKLGKKRWMEAESFLFDDPSNGLRYTIGTIINGRTLATPDISILHPHHQRQKVSVVPAYDLARPPHNPQIALSLMGPKALCAP
jgi:hypothetical protein